MHVKGDLSLLFYLDLIVQYYLRWGPVMQSDNQTLEPRWCARALRGLWLQELNVCKTRHETLRLINRVRAATKTRL